MYMCTRIANRCTVHAHMYAGSLVPRRSKSGGRNTWYALFTHVRGFKVDDVVVWVRLQFYITNVAPPTWILLRPLVYKTEESPTKLPSMSSRSLTMPPPLEVSMPLSLDQASNLIYHQH